MMPDSYQVEVLHYLNPHLIWVEVTDPLNEKPGEFVFEQIGVYGVLPQEITVTDDTLTLETRRCESWAPATVLSMKKLFQESIEVWFSPVHIDRRNSIFDTNIHKYGEIVIKKKNGKYKSLSKKLTKSNFAFNDPCLFHQELSLGKLKTKLNGIQRDEVIKQLIQPGKEKVGKERERSVKSQTHIVHIAKNLESPLTVQNLEKHTRNLDVHHMLQNKIKDLDKCKDVEEESVGRGVSHKVSEMPRSSLLKKKLELSGVAPRPHNKHDPVSILLATKKFLEANSKIREDVTSGSSVKGAEDNVKEIGECIKSTDECKLDSPVKLNENHSNYEISVKKTPKYAKKKSKTKVPEYDITTEQRVAYGPPGLQHQKMSLKIVSKSTDNELIKCIEGTHDNTEEIHEKSDAYDGLDSVVGIEINNKELYKLLPHIKKAETSVDETDNESITKEKIKLTNNATETCKSVCSKALQNKLRLHKERIINDSLSSDIGKDSSSSMEEEKREKKKANKDLNEENIHELVEKLTIEYGSEIKTVNTKNDVELTNVHNVVSNNNVNPFKNVDPSLSVLSVFVEKLVMPVLMVHSKTNKRIQPCIYLRDVNFTTNIHVVLKNMNVEKPMMLQTVSWYTILRGYSLFMISPLGSGKTLGYVPAVCRLVSDSKMNNVDSVGPSCIIVCGTAKSVSEVEQLCRVFLGLEERVVACYAGMDELFITSSLLNGCDLFICTPSVLVRLLQMTDFGLDLRRLSTFVLEDSERLAEVYSNEVKFFLIKIKEMLKNRANKELKVQFVVASRIWCDFMESLSIKAPNSIVCIGAFQECVLYSKANTSVNFVKKENKINTVFEFLELIDGSKRTVIVCRSNDEVGLLEKNLERRGKIVFGCDDTMTVHDLYNLNKQWNEYQEPLLGPILVCCDGNLTHLNVSDAHYLIHYSLPELFSMFCKRFSVLNDNYPSIFKRENETVKIKILLDDSNVEQLPKILHFVKRCTNEVPQFLDEICSDVIKEKNVGKAKKLVPVCDSLLALGECPDFWNCLERHAIFKQYDEPKDWMPKTGIITFKILHFQTAVAYSARLLSNVTKSGTTKYPQTYSTVSLKMGMYYSKELNRQLHGIPKVGDFCAVSIKLNFFARCQVVKILSHYQKGNPNYVLIKLIDEEKLERSRDIYLYHLPEDLKNIETHVVQVRMANIKPKDKDITFSDLSRDQLKKITEKQELYMRGQIALTIGNCVFIDTLEACQDLTSLNETVVADNFKKTLLEGHAMPHPDHIPKLEKLCQDGGLDVKIQEPEVLKPVKEPLKPRWAHLDADDISSVFFASAENPGTFFVRHVKFEDCMNMLLKDIQKYVAENPEPVIGVKKGDIVLAKFPDDSTYERARVDEIYNKDKVKIFFVDQGDWRDVSVNHLIAIPDKFITKMPCQAIECRLIGVKPAGDDWTEFGTNWFSDNCFEDNDGRIKQLYIKYFTKETPQYTGGHKYGVALIDTNGDQDVLINQLMIDVNLAKEDVDEMQYFDKLDFTKVENDNQSGQSEDDWEKITVPGVKDTPEVSLENVFPKKPIRSVPLVQDSDDDSDQWDVNMSSDFASMFKSLTPNNKNRQTEEEKGDSNLVVAKVENNKLINKLSEIKASSDCTNVCSLENMQVAKISDIDKPLNIECKNLEGKIKEKNEILEAQELDSDDFSSTKDSQDSEITETNQSITDIKLIPDFNKELLINKVDELRKPKVVWKQHNKSVMIKIQLIGVDIYDLVIEKRLMKFFAINNDTNYGFEIELYGVVDDKKYSHCNKGQYILIHLKKVMNKTWLTLTRDGGIKKWIIYDVDSIDTSSDEEEKPDDTMVNVIRNMHNKSDSESDDDLLDDINFKYGAH
ncbi:RNA helicase-like protein [Aphomia sociella]